MGTAAGLVVGGGTMIAFTGQRLPVTLGWIALVGGAAFGIWMLWTALGRKLRYPVLVLGLVLLFGLVSAALGSLTAGVETSVSVSLQVDLASLQDAAIPDAVVPFDGEGIYILLPRVLVTNHGFEPVALAAYWILDWQDGSHSTYNSTRVPPPMDFPIGHLIPGYSSALADPPLEFPLNLAPQSSVRGSVGLWLSPGEWNFTGGRDLRTGGWASLYLGNLLSGKEVLIFRN